MKGALPGTNDSSLCGEAAERRSFPHRVNNYVYDSASLTFRFSLLLSKMLDVVEHSLMNPVNNVV